MHLDYSIEFVKQVWECKQNAIAVEKCVSTLEDACRRHGLNLIVPALKVNDKGTSIDARLPDVCYISHDENQWKQWVYTSFFDFLSETHLVLSTNSYSSRYSVIIGPIEIGATDRAFGALYAKWANSTSWLGKKDWNYIPFYNGNISDEYWEWSEAAFSIVERMNSK